MKVPDFLVRQFYVGGSLQHEGNGFRVQARNGMGDGTIVKIGRISVDDTDIDAANITATLDGQDAVHRAADVSQRAPVAFSRGAVVTFHIADHPLEKGEHRFEVEIYEVNLGLLTLALKDTVRDG
jgi:hypothetical protein